MEYERAKKIVSDCMAHVWFREQLTTEYPPSLKAFSLRELLDANELIAAHPGERDEEKGTTTHMMHCDPRLVAALYTLYHYPAEDPDSEGPLEAVVGHASAVVVVVKVPNERALSS